MFGCVLSCLKVYLTANVFGLVLVKMTFNKGGEWGRLYSTVKSIFHKTLIYLSSMIKARSIPFL